MLVSIVTPTVDGRELWLKRSLKAFCANTSVEIQSIVIRNRPVCGIAWNDGIAAAHGDYILLSADDLEPLPGWFEAAVSAVEDGVLPAPRILNTDGSLQSCGDVIEEMPDGTVVDLNRIPFASRDVMIEIGPILPIHYATDYWFSHRARELGWDSVVIRDFCFYHHFATEGRLDHRLMSDMNRYWKAAGLKGEPRLPGQ